MPVIDTSVLVALGNRKDTHHARARKLINRPGPFIVPAIILHEFVGAVGRRSARLHGRTEGRAAARRAYTQVVSESIFRVEPDFDVEVAGRAFLDHQKLTFADAVAATMARSRRDELLTFDTAQRDLAESR